MVKIGITGQSGFIGTHLANKIQNLPNDFELISFKDYYFEEDKLLQNFVKECDFIVHLAAMMRSTKNGEVFSVNVELVEKVIRAINNSKSVPNVLFASSIQENNGSEYAQSKLIGKSKFIELARKNKSGFGCMTLPNIFGPGAKPNSHSFIATFCHKLNRNENPEIIVDNFIHLKYIESLVNEIIQYIFLIINTRSISQLEFRSDYDIKVSEVLSILKTISLSNCEELLINSSSNLVKDLYNTYVAYK